MKVSEIKKKLRIIINDPKIEYSAHCYDNGDCVIEYNDGSKKILGCHVNQYRSARMVC